MNGENPIFIIFIAFYRACLDFQGWEPVRFHETKSSDCYCCVFQALERNYLGISKAPDPAEIPQCNLRSETADRIQTQFYFTDTKARNLGLFLSNWWWVKSFKPIKNTEGDRAESKGFIWHRKGTKPCYKVTWPRCGPVVLSKHSPRARVTVFSGDTRMWNNCLHRNSSLLSF